MNLHSYVQPLEGLYLCATFGLYWTPCWVPCMFVVNLSLPGRGRNCYRFVSCHGWPQVTPKRNVDSCRWTAHDCTQHPFWFGRWWNGFPNQMRYATACTIFLSLLRVQTFFVPIDGTLLKHTRNIVKIHKNQIWRWKRTVTTATNNLFCLTAREYEFSNIP
jgi:hypothetical protein